MVTAALLDQYESALCLTLIIINHAICGPNPTTSQDPTCCSILGHQCLYSRYHHHSLRANSIVFALTLSFVSRPPSTQTTLARTITTATTGSTNTLLNRYHQKNSSDIIGFALPLSLTILCRIYTMLVMLHWSSLWSLHAAYRWIVLGLLCAVWFVLLLEYDMIASASIWSRRNNSIPQDHVLRAGFIYHHSDNSWNCTLINESQPQVNYNELMYMMRMELESEIRKQAGSWEVVGFGPQIA